jgi:hypothetical protein
LVAGSRAERQSAAMVGFEILGPEAAPAIPALTNRFDWRFLYGVNDQIFMAFNHMGNDGLAPLLAVATNKTVPGEMRAHAVTRIRDPLMRVDTNANWAVPVLVDLLKDPVTGPRAAVTLGDLRLDPPVTVPALTACVQDKGAWYNIYAAESLGRFGKGATSAVPALLEALSSTNRYLRMAATNALETIAPEVLKKDGH